MPGPSAWDEFVARDPETAHRIFDRVTGSLDRQGGNATEEQVKTAYATLTPEQRAGSARSVELALVNHFVDTPARGRLRGGSRHPDDAQMPNAINLDAALAEVESVQSGDDLSSSAVRWVAAVERGDVVLSVHQAERFAARGIRGPDRVPTVHGRSNAEPGPSRHQGDTYSIARTDVEAGHVEFAQEEDDSSSRPPSSLDVLQGRPPTDEMQARPAPHELPTCTSSSGDFGRLALWRRRALSSKSIAAQ